MHKNHRCDSEFDNITCKSKEVGNPTTLLLPMTVTCLPISSIPDWSNNSMQAFAAQGTNKGFRLLRARLPTFKGWKPSTSFSRLMVLRILSSSINYTKLGHRIQRSTIYNIEY